MPINIKKMFWITGYNFIFPTNSLRFFQKKIFLKYFQSLENVACLLLKQKNVLKIYFFKINAQLYYNIKILNNNRKRIISINTFFF